MNYGNLDKPVFVEIDPITLKLDPRKSEAAITPPTTCILPVHCYDTPCDVHSIEKIADVHNLRVIYDAAHAFAVADSKFNRIKASMALVLGEQALPARACEITTFIRHQLTR